MIEEALSCPCVADVKEDFFFGVNPTSLPAVHGWRWTQQNGSCQVLRVVTASFLTCTSHIHLSQGPCGEPFVGSFACFIRSDVPDKCTATLPQECMMKNPEAFQEFFTEREEKEEVETKAEASASS
eukprot:1181657-Prorocentrum_minimum.AAC.2